MEKKVKILSHFKKQERPYFSIIQKSGTITVETITSDMTTRRTRPQEQEQNIAPRRYDGFGMKPLPAPKVPGNTDAERMSNAVKMLFGAPKEAFVKAETKHKRAQERKKQQATEGLSR